MEANIAPWALLLWSDVLVPIITLITVLYLFWRLRKGKRSTSMPSSAASHSDFMLPKHVFLVRHGESLGNVNQDMFKEMPDWKIGLTSKGKEQARQAGEDMKRRIGDAPVVIYYSPYIRTQQTVKQIVKSLSSKQIVFIEEDPRLREQDFGNFQNAAMSKYKKERIKFGRFFYRFPNGESGADVYDRVSSFLDSMFRHFRKHAAFTHANPEYNLVIVSHGLTIRIILMRWFRWSVHQFDNLINPRNACSIILERSQQSNQLRLSSESWRHLTIRRSRQVSESEPDLTMGSSLSCETNTDSDEAEDDQVQGVDLDGDGELTEEYAPGWMSYRWDKNLAKFTAQAELTEQSVGTRPYKRKPWQMLRVRRDLHNESKLSHHTTTIPHSPQKEGMTDSE